MKISPRLLVLPFAVLASVLSARTTPLSIDQTVEARFPAALALTSITDGEARVVVNIGPDGKLIDYLVTGYTDRLFAEEAVTVLKAWRYTPPTEDGQPIGVRTEVRFNFEAHGKVVSLTACETAETLMRQMGLGATFTASVCRPHELDRPLAAIDTVAPLYPAPAAGAPDSQPQSVVVDFYVDERGHPRMPVVVNAPQNHYAAAAMDALNRWRFVSPTRAGRPVAVRVRQEFIFPGRS